MSYSILNSSSPFAVLKKIFFLIAIVIAHAVVASRDARAEDRSATGADQTAVASSQRHVVLRLPTNQSIDRNHPLLPAMGMAQDGLDHIDREIRDYSCLVVRRERVKGRLGKHEYIQAKVRHRRTTKGREIPFAIYLKFLGPSSVKGREVLYVEGENNGKMFVRNGGKKFAYIVTEMRPESRLAMRDNRYPLTEFGVRNLFARLIEVAEDDIASGVETKVKFFEEAKVNGRVCTGVHVQHQTEADSDRFYMAKVFMDNELKIPIHYEAYGWPKDGSSKAQLLEQYTYTRVKLNVGFTDRDFDPNNPKYKLTVDEE